MQVEKLSCVHSVTQRTLQALVTILQGKGNAAEEEVLLERCKEAGIKIHLPADEEALAPEGGDDRVVKIFRQFRQTKPLMANSRIVYASVRSWQRADDADTRGKYNRCHGRYIRLSIGKAAKLVTLRHKLIVGNVHSIT